VGTNVSYVAQKVKEHLNWDGQFRESCERAEKIYFLRVDPNFALTNSASCGIGLPLVLNCENRLIPR